MLVVHASSTCDVCLEGYTTDNVPHAITCGHIFCLRCLQSLNRHCCPLCRQSFSTSDVRRLHIDSRSSPSTPRPVNTTTEIVQYSSQARVLLDHITRIVREGAPAAEVRELIEHVRDWLMSQGPEEHTDLRSSFMLLFKFTELQCKTAEERRAYFELQRTCDDLKDQIEIERHAVETAQANYEDVSRALVEEQETTKAVEKSLKEHFDRMDLEWRGKYEICLSECRRMNDELKQYRYNPLPARPTEGRYIYRTEKNTESRSARDDVPDSVFKVPGPTGNKDDMFRLSPLPSTLPIPALPATMPDFQALTDDIEERDEEDGRKSTNPYGMRSIPPIPINQKLHRMPSNSSLLSRHDMDIVPRSLPRGSVDIHMASCSSSPNVSASYYTTRERRAETISGFVGHEDRPGFRNSDISRRPSIGSRADSRDQDHQAQQERWRAQLRELLDTPVSTVRPLRRNAESESETPKQLTSRETLIPPSTPSPVSPSAPVVVSASASAALYQPPSAMSCHRPNLISRASTAAMAAERARATSGNNSSPSPTSAAQAATTRERETRERESIQTPARPQHPPRRPSTENTKAKSLSNPSGLTRSLWASQETQQRV